MRVLLISFMRCKLYVCLFVFSLKTYLEAFLEERDSEPKWIEKMPEEILVKHAVPLFEFSVVNDL